MLKTNANKGMEKNEFNIWFFKKIQIIRFLIKFNINLFNRYVQTAAISITCMAW
jgi:hypothetical protein